MSLRILIDTNIIIALEDNRMVDKEFSDFYNYAVSNSCKIFFHPACLLDIENDRDLERKKIIQSKFRKYQRLPNPGKVTKDFIKEVGEKNKNDQIDNIQLFQLHKGYVDIFVTEDNGILKKARKIGCSETTLSLKKALEKLQKKFEFRIPQHPVLRHCSIREIEGCLEDSFFDSLRDNYAGFDEWFNKCARLNRYCYNLKIAEKISALLIYNEEKPKEHKLPGIQENALKICTFKTSENVFGAKIGELFLNKMLQYCIEKNIGYVYLTLFEKYKMLMGLLTKFGFEKKEFINKRNQKELIMIKDLSKEEMRRDIVLNQRKFHPFYSDAARFKKIVIPIKKSYYYSLFKDSSLREPGLFDKIDSTREIQGNSIIKAYICSAKTRNLEKGDILFFYASKHLKVIEAIGILEQSARVNDLEKLMKKVRGKTVFTEKMLEDMFNSKTSEYLLVIIFRLTYYLERPIEFERIKKLKCFANKFITITKMDEEEYQELKKEAYFDERYLID